MNVHARRKLMWIGAALLGVILLFAAISRKKSIDVADVVFHIEHLADGEHDLIKEGELKKEIYKSFETSLKGVPITEVDIIRLEQVLEAVPYVAEADVYADALNRVSINIKQREPIMRIIDRDNKDYYLDKNGIQMSPTQHYTARVVAATGNIPPYSLDFQKRKKYVLKDLFNLVLLIEQTDFFKALAEQIYVNNAGEFIMIPKLGNQKILLGTGENMEDKLRRLEIFYKEALPYQGWDKYSVINLKYKGQVVAKKR